MWKSNKKKVRNSFRCRCRRRRRRRPRGSLSCAFLVLAPLPPPPPLELLVPQSLPERRLLRHLSVDPLLERRVPQNDSGRGPPPRVVVEDAGDCRRRGGGGGSLCLFVVVVAAECLPRPYRGSRLCRCLCEEREGPRGRGRRLFFGFQRKRERGKRKVSVRLFFLGQRNRPWSNSQFARSRSHSNLVRQLGEGLSPFKLLLMRARRGARCCCCCCCRNGRTNRGLLLLLLGGAAKRRGSFSFGVGLPCSRGRETGEPGLERRGVEGGGRQSVLVVRDLEGERPLGSSGRRAAARPLEPAGEEGEKAHRIEGIETRSVEGEKKWKREKKKKKKKSTNFSPKLFSLSFASSLRHLFPSPLSLLSLSSPSSGDGVEETEREREIWPTAAVRKERPNPYRCRPDRTHQMPGMATTTMIPSLPPPSPPRALARPRPCSRPPSTG